MVSIEVKLYELVVFGDNSFSIFVFMRDSSKIDAIKCIGGPSSTVIEVVISKRDIFRDIIIRIIGFKEIYKRLVNGVKSGLFY